MCFDCDLLVTEHDIRMNKYIVCYKYVILNMYSRNTLHIFKHHYFIILSIFCTYTVYQICMGYYGM